MSDEQQPTQTPEKIEFGFDKEGYLRIKIHMSMGMWNILGALVEAQTRVMAYFEQIAEAQRKEESRKGLVRPNGNLERHHNKRDA